jgi:hypothetical protein
MRYGLQNEHDLARATTPHANAEAREKTPR